MEREQKSSATRVKYVRFSLPNINLHSSFINVASFGANLMKNDCSVCTPRKCGWKYEPNRSTDNDLINSNAHGKYSKSTVEDLRHVLSIIFDNSSHCHSLLHGIKSRANIRPSTRTVQCCKLFERAQNASGGSNNFHNFHR
jgi:hypothetical protein